MATKNIKVKVNVENNFVIDKTEEQKLCKILVSKGENGKDGTVSFDELTEEQRASLKGEDGKGVPSGGKVGQILAKTSDNDFDAEWIDNNAEVDLTEYAKKDEIPTKMSDLENDSNFLVMNDDYNHVTGRLHVSNNFDDYQERKVDISTQYLIGAENGGLPSTLYINAKCDTDVRILQNGTGTLYYKGNEVADRYYVDEQIANIEIKGGDIDLSDYALKEDLNTKTDTTILPNDFGDVKTRFRICNKAEDESPVIYFPLVKLPQDNSKNSASVILKGRVGGFLSKDMAMINALIWNRTTTGISLFNINADTYTLEEPLRLCDIVVYTNDDTTDTVYLKCREWYVFDIDLEVYQSTAEILYDGTYLTEEPTGTLSATASTSDKRVEVFNGKLYLNGTELTGGSGSDYELPVASSSTLGGIKVGANLTIDDEGVLSAIGGSGEISGEITGEVLPIGTMLPYASTNNIPTNWRICDGSEVSRTTYADLFNVIGTAYGEGDGETTFNLPDKRGRVSVGLDKDQSRFNSIGEKGGEKEHTLTVNEMPSHNHTVDAYQGTTTWQYGHLWGRASNESHMNLHQPATSYVGGNQPHNNLQPYEVDLWIIKVSNIVSVLEETTGTIIDNLTSTSSTDALSSNMGRVLNERITSIEENGVGGDSMVTYSTKEQRIGTWVDGTPIYRKVVDFGYLPNASSKFVDHDIENIDKIISVSGFGVRTDGWYFNLPFISTIAMANCIQLNATTTQIEIRPGSDRTTVYAYVILEYTKQ